MIQGVCCNDLYMSGHVSGDEILSPLYTTPLNLLVRYISICRDAVSEKVSSSIYVIALHTLICIIKSKKRSFATYGVLLCLEAVKYY